jgi:hypothetical protein
MNAGLAASQIEFFRKRYHGDQMLRCLRLNADEGQTLTLIETLTRGFYISKNTDTSIGAIPYILTVDTRYTGEGLTEDEIYSIYAVDLVDQGTGKFRRYETDTNDPPQTAEWRYLIGVRAAFNNKKAIV